MTEIAPVDCGSCHKCCHLELVVLQPEDDPATYDCREVFTPSGNITVLNHKPNGDCVYLGENGCTIHGRHPRMCKIFDCAAWAAMWPRHRRRQERRRRGINVDSEVLKEGLRRLTEARQRHT